MDDDTSVNQSEAVMGRPPKAIKLQDPIGIRFTEDQLSRIDRLLEAGRTTWPDVGVTDRNSLIRHLVDEAIKVVTPPKRRR
jgi:hypothetical protein